MIFEDTYAFWWVILWDGKVYLYEEEPTAWSMAIDDYGPIPLCHDELSY